MVATLKQGARPPVAALILIVAAAIFLNYIDRGAIGIAAPLMIKDLHLSATRFGIAVSAFFWVYAPIQLLIGRLCDRLPVYRIFGAGVALWAASTFLTTFVGGLVSLITLRVLLGIGESVAFPGSSKMIARHVPAERRGIANALIGAALAIGPAAGTLPPPLRSPGPCGGRSSCRGFGYSTSTESFAPLFPHFFGGC